MFINRLAFGSFKTGLEDNLRRAVESMENAVKNNFGEDEEYADHVRQIEVYKQLLVEMELGQLKVLREYQKLFAEKEARIAALTKDTSSVDTNQIEVPHVGKSPDSLRENSNASGDAEKDREEEAKDAFDAPWVKDWENQMKINISEKMDAMVQAREYRETTQVLQDQLASLKEHMRAQDLKVEQLERLEELRKAKEEGDENALDSLAMEYSKLSQEAEESNQKNIELARERDDLAKRIERQREQIEVLLQTDPRNSIHREQNDPEGNDDEDDEEEQILELSALAHVKTSLAERNREVEELRSHLEQATATSKAHVQDITSLEASLSATQEALEVKAAELEALRTSTKAEHVQLSVQAAHVADIEELQNALKAAQDDAETKVSDLETSLAALQVQKKQLAAQVSSLETDNARLNDENNSSSSELLGNLRRAEEALQAKTAELEELQTSRQAEEEKANALATKLREEMERLQASQSANDSELQSNLLAAQEELSLKASALQSLEQSSQSELETLRRNVEEAQNRLEAEVKVREQQSADYDRSLSELKTELAAKQQTLEEMETASASQSEALCELKKSLEAKSQELEAALLERTDLETAIEKAKADLESAEQSHDLVNADLEAKTKDLSEAQIIIETKQHEIQALETERAANAESLKEAEAKVAQKDQELSEKIAALDAAETLLAELRSELERTKAIMAKAQEDHEVATASLQTKLQQTVAQLKESSTALSELETLKELMEREHETVMAEEREEAARIRAEIEDTFHSTVERMQAEILQLEESKQAELTKLREECNQRVESAEIERDEALIATAEIKKEADAEKAAALAEQEERLSGVVEEYRGRYIRENSLRKRVHNELMDIKGNIRVYCRVRPVLQMERRKSLDGSKDVISYPVDNEIEVARDEVTMNRFEFDAVFQPVSTQEEVFEDISPLVTSTLDGYDVCIFAYGQTGSGKTFTMEGSKEDPGVNLRALHRLFQLRQDRREEETFEFTVSILEIYNESVRDLLAPMDASTGRAKLDLRVATNGKVYVQDLETVQVDSMDDVRNAMRNAQGNRSVGSHSMNERSSRSHLVFMLNISGENLITGAKTTSKLNLIDLAGSERISKTDASGDRLKEAQNINKSLSALGDVIAALGDSKARQQHVPYRNSKLTHLLQNSLEGGSKVAMFVNISPVRSNAPESVCSLNFAARCRKVQLGQAKRNGESADLKKYKRLVDDLRSQLAAQSRSLGASTSSLSSLTGSNTPRKPRKLSSSK
mmetsp:Transcript_16315/g.31655  ORF Transcript_16315/g.31655 Transcript_16315/m.31655 type:complete len:1254 (-) Transcript_16315:604-4365(-)